MNAYRSVGRGLLTLGLAALLAVGLVESIQRFTAEPIAAARARARAEALQVVLPADRFDNALADDVVQVRAAALGAGAHRVYRARREGKPVALIVEASAPDGYAGAIDLLASIDGNGRIIAVRVTRHRETPGLGDAIEAARSDWIRGFDGRGLGDPPEQDWSVQRDGGAFDQLAGATVSSRAVAEAVQRCLALVAAHREALFDSASGSTLHL